VVSVVEPYYGDDEAYDAYRRRKEPEWRDLFSRLRRYLRRPGAPMNRDSEARVLDIGCARGYSTAVARELGFDAYGVEPSAADAQYARDELGLPVRTGTLEQAGFAAGFFDAVVMWSVLEHLSAPMTTMAEIARILRPGGIVNIFTPNGDSRAARAQGAAWIEYNRPGHVVLFSPATVRRLLAAHGLQPLEIYTTLGGGAQENIRAGEQVIRSIRARRALPLRTCSPVHLIRSLAMRPGLAPLRRRVRRVIAALAPRAASAGEYMGVYGEKRLEERS